MDGQAIEAYQQAGLRPADGVWEERPDKIWHRTNEECLRLMAELQRYRYPKQEDTQWLMDN